MYRTSANNELFFNYSAPSSEYNINRINNLINKTEKQLNEIQYSLGLYKEEQVRVIKEEIYYFNFPKPTIDKSRNWLKMIKEKYDKRKKYDEKSSFEFLTKTISNELFLGKQVEIYNIMYGGYEGYSDIIEFHCEGMDFNLVIPNLKVLTVENLAYAHYGKMSVYVAESRNVITMIAEDYDEDKIVEDIKKFFNNTERINEIKENYKKA